MGNLYYSYCCGKPVNRLDGKLAYECSRCHRPLTVYGNAKLAADKEAEKQKNKQIISQSNIHGNEYKVLENGDLSICGLVYPKAELYDAPNHFIENKIVVDANGNYVTAVKIIHESEKFYVENDVFDICLKKVHLCSIGMDYYNTHKHILGTRPMLKIDELRGNPRFKQNLIDRGFVFLTPNK